MNIICKKKKISNWKVIPLYSKKNSLIFKKDVSTYIEVLKTDGDGGIKSRPVARLDFRGVRNSRRWTFWTKLPC